jgi:hypothetical protein
MQNTNIMHQETSNANKFDDPSILPFFILGQPTVFVLNNHFFQAPHSIDDDFSPIHPRGSS